MQSAISPLFSARFDLPADVIVDIHSAVGVVSKVHKPKSELVMVVLLHHVVLVLERGEVVVDSPFRDIDLIRQFRDSHSAVLF